MSDRSVFRRAYSRFLAGHRGMALVYLLSVVMVLSSFYLQDGFGEPTRLELALLIAPLLLLFWVSLVQGGAR